MSLNTTPRTFVTGEVETAAIFNAEVRDALTGIQAAWTAYGPTATNFTVGNGSLTGRWAQLGKTAVGVRINLVAGTTTTYTASAMQVSLPAAAHATGPQFLPARLYFTAGQFAAAASITAGSSVAALETPASTANCGLVSMSSASPNPGTAGSLILEGTFETA